MANLYQGSVGNLSTSQRNLNVATDIKAKSEVADKTYRQAMASVDQMSQRDAAMISNWRNAGAMTDKSKALDLQNWAKMFDGMEKVIGVIAKQQAKDKKDDIEFGKTQLGLNKDDYNKIQQNDVVREALRKNELQGESLKKAMIDAGVTPDFADDFVGYNKNVRKGFQMGAMLEVGNTLPQKLEPYLEAHIFADPSQGTEWTTDQAVNYPGGLTSGGKQARTFYDKEGKPYNINSRSEFDRLTSAQRQPVYDALVQSIIDDPATPTYGFNRGILTENLYKPLKKAVDKISSDAATTASTLRAYDVKQGQDQTVLSNLAQVYAGKENEDIAVESIASYMKGLDAAAATLAVNDELGTKTTAEWKLDKFDELVKGIYDELEPQNVDTFERVLKKALDSEQTDLPWGKGKSKRGTLEGHPKLAMMNFKLYGMQKRNKTFDIKQKRLKADAFGLANNKLKEIDDAYNDKGVIPKPADLQQWMRNILSKEGNRGMRRNKEAMDALREVVNWKPVALDNAGSTIRVGQLVDEYGLIIPSDATIPLDGDVLKEVSESQGLAIRPTAFGEGTDKEKVELAKKEIAAAVNPGKPLGRLGDGMSEWRSDNVAVAHNAIYEAELEAQRIQIKAWNDSGQRHWMSDYDAIMQVKQNKIDEITAGLQDPSSRYHNVDGIWMKKSLATTVDAKYLNPAGALLHQIETDVRDPNITIEDILQKNYFKDKPDLLELNAQGNIKTTTQQMAHAVGMAPGLFVQKMKSVQENKKLELSEIFAPETQTLFDKLGGWDSEPLGVISSMAQRGGYNPLEVNRSLCSAENFWHEFQIKRDVTNILGNGNGDFEAARAASEAQTNAFSGLQAYTRTLHPEMTAEQWQQFMDNPLIRCMTYKWGSNVGQP